MGDSNESGTCSPGVLESLFEMSQGTGGAEMKRGTPTNPDQGRAGDISPLFLREPDVAHHVPESGLPNSMFNRRDA